MCIVYPPNLNIKRYLWVQNMAVKVLITIGDLDKKDINDLAYAVTGETNVSKFLRFMIKDLRGNKEEIKIMKKRYEESLKKGDV